MSAGKLTWERWTLLVAAVLAAVTPFLPVPRLQLFFERPIPLWITLVAIAILAFGLARIRRPLPYSLKINGDPEAIVGDKPNQFRLTGQYDSLPDGAEVWLITAATNGQAYWPQGKVGIDRAKKEWTGRVGLGPTNFSGERMRVILAVVPKCGQILCAYYLATTDEKKPGHKLALPELPADVIECDSLEIAKQPLTQNTVVTA